ncbi:MAG: ATP-grasp domain-containing protein, partial [Myxococcales bacterium]|nr:ATP-grasp domain-containing protein [Myxococcales bacterium]
YYTLSERDLEDLEETHGSFGFPVFVKPRRSGSSVGAGRADSMAELAEKVEDALRFDSSVIVERFIRGREVAVALMDGKALGAIEISPKGNFYDYKSKYQSGQSEYHLPARLPPTRYKGVLHIAERANQCLGTTGATRVDLLVTEGENEYVLEVNTLPGMTPTSLLPKIAKGCGWDFADLCEEILARATVGTRSSLRPARGPSTAPPPVGDDEQSTAPITSVGLEAP